MTIKDNGKTQTSYLVSGAVVFSPLKLLSFSIKPSDKTTFVLK